MLSSLEIVVQQACLHHNLKMSLLILVSQRWRLPGHCFVGWTLTRVCCFLLQQVRPRVSKVGCVQDNPLGCRKKIFFCTINKQINQNSVYLPFISPFFNFYFCVHFKMHTIRYFSSTCMWLLDIHILEVCAQKFFTDGVIDQKSLETTDLRQAELHVVFRTGRHV